MATVAELPASVSASAFPAVQIGSSPAEVLSEGSSGTWILELPPYLAPHQSELETLISQVFNGRPRSQDNLELARQLVLNWCLSKSRKMGITIKDI
jgi:hypothetical protein